MNTNEKKASDKVMQLLTSNWINQALYTVVKLKIPDILKEKPENINSLSQKTDSYSPYLYRVMKALSSLGFFKEKEKKIFHLTTEGEILQEDKMRAIILMFLSPWHNTAWSHLYKAVKTGTSPFESAFKTNCFQWLNENPQAAAEFNKANELKSRGNLKSLLKAYNFNQFNYLVDIGGGYGGLLLGILQKYSKLKGCITDKVHVKIEIENKIKRTHMEDRCQFIESDFFKNIPEMGDGYILCNILHDWDDDKCCLILKNCYKVMDSNSKLLVLESLLNEKNQFSISNLLDLEMLVMGGGKERTLNQYQKILNKSKFKLSRVIKTQDHLSVLECMKE